jgi:zinc transport system substrate-binding protein
VGVALIGLLPLVGLAGLLGGCASSLDAGVRSASAAGQVPVLASFYPLQFVAEQVGGAHVAVGSLTRPGTEPHDLELSAQDVAAVDDAARNGLVVYLSGFQPAVDDAVATAGGSRGIVDVADAADLDLTTTVDGEPGSGVDPHFWLDPTRLASVTRLVADRLSAVDPEHAAEYQRNAAALRADLGRLDAQYRSGLQDCRSRDLVTSHAAFGYLAQRYDLTQRGIVGLNPDAEPSPAQLADVAAFVRQNDVSTIFFETLASPAVAETVARETGAHTAVLDPIEGITDASAGDSYPAVMESNLAALQEGLGCT